jgi:hypothetical protein
VTAGVGAALGTAGGIPNLVVRSAVSNAMTQGISVATGLQDQFNWAGVAASAVGAAVGGATGQAVGSAVSGPTLDPFIQKLITGTAAGIVAGGTTALMRGGRVSMQQIATDAFGNALGQGLVDAASGPGYSAQEVFRQGEIGERNATESIGGAQRRVMHQPLGDTGFGMDAEPVPRELNPIHLPKRSSSPMSWLAATDYGGVINEGGTYFGGAVIVGEEPEPVEFAREEFEAMGRGVLQAANAPRGGSNSDGSDLILARTRIVHRDSGTTMSTSTSGRQDLWDRLNMQYGTDIDFNALSRFEGGQLLEGYVPQSNGRVLGRSGVTIATGFDIGQMHATQLDQLGLPQDLAAKLRPYAGLIKGGAVDFLTSTPLSVTRDEAMQIDFAVKGMHLRSAAESWNSSDPTVMFTDLTQAQQTVIFSRTFHQGVGMPNTREAQDFYSAATQGRWLDAEAALRNYPVRDNWYRNRVGIEADLLLKERVR